MPDIGFNDNHVPWATKYIDLEPGQKFVLLTNHFETPALTVVLLPMMRCCIKLFFRWIKGQLRIKCYFETSPPFSGWHPLRRRGSGYSNDP